MPKGKSKKKKNKEADKPKNGQSKPDDIKEETTPLSPLPPGGTPPQQLFKNVAVGATASSTPEKDKKKKWYSSTFGKKSKDKETQSSRRSSSSSVKSPQGASSSPKQQRSLAIQQEFGSSYEYVPAGSDDVVLKEFQTEPVAKYSTHSSSGLIVSQHVESEMTPKLDSHIPDKDPRSQLSLPTTTLTPSSTQGIPAALTPTNSHPLQSSLSSTSSAPAASVGSSLSKSSNVTPETSLSSQTCNDDKTSTPLSSYGPSHGKSSVSSDPLDNLQTSPNTNTATPIAVGGIEPSIGDANSHATQEASEQDKFQEGGAAVFYMENDNSATDVMTNIEDQLRRENADLDRRLSEMEDSIKVTHQESSQRVQAMRTKSFEAQQQEMEKILTDITEQHKKVLKQRILEMERQNQEAVRKRKKELERENAALQRKLDSAKMHGAATTGKALKEKQHEFNSLKTELTAKDEQLKELQEKVEATPQLEDEIKQLKAELANRDAQVEELKQAANAAQEQIDTLNADLAEKEKQLKELQTQVETTRQQHKEEIKQLNAKLADRDTQVEEFKQAVNTAREQKNEIDTSLNAELAEKDKQLQELQSEVEATRQHEEEIKQLNTKLDERDVQLKRHEATIQEQKNKIETLEANLAQEKDQAEELAKHNEEKMTTAIHERDLKIKELHKKLETVRENDETENLNAEIKQQDKKIKQLEDELKAERTKAYEIDHPLKSGEAADDDTLATQIDTMKAEMKAERQKHEELIAQIEAEKLDAIAKLKVKHKIEIKEAREAAVQDIQHQQKAEELHETAQYKELRQQLEDKEVGLDAATAELALVRGRLEEAEKENRQLQEVNAQLQVTIHQQIQGDFQPSPDEYRQLQEKHHQLREEFHQLKVIADMKKEMAPTTSGGFVSSVDPEEEAVQVEKPLLTQSKDEITQRDDSQDSEDEQAPFHTALQIHETNNMTDTQKVEQLERKLEQTQQESENLRQESQKLRDELDRLRVQSQTQGDQKKDPQQQQATFENLRKNYMKVFDEKMDLLAKLEARDEELKQLRDQKAGTSETHPNFARSLSADRTASLDDPQAEVVRLREVIKTKEDNIANLEVQLRSFQDVATEKKKFQDHSQDQSRIVMELKQQLEQAQEEVRAVRDGSKDAEQIESLKLKLNEAEKQCSAAEHEKRHLEDEVHVWKQEVEAERQNVMKLKREIASLQTQRRSHDPLSYQQELTEREVAVGQIQTQQNLFEVEMSSLRAKLTQKRQALEELTRENIVLNQRLKVITDNYNDLQPKYHDMVGKLERVDRMAAQMEAFRTQVANLKAIITQNTEELETSKQQAAQYKEDFERERKDREDAAGRYDDELASWQDDYRKLEKEKLDEQELLQQTLKLLQEEINKLKEENEQQKEQIIKLEHEAQNHQEILRETQKALDDQNEQNTKLSDQIAELKEENIKLKNSFDAARTESEHHIAKLNQHHEAEKQQRLDRITELEDEVAVVTATKTSLEEKIEDIETKLHSKEKHLEIALNEKAALEERIERIEAQRVGLHHDKADLQRKLESAIKDTSDLSDEVMAKNQQVKQCRKQVEEYKVELNQTRAELERVKGQLQQSRTRIQEQAQYYQEQLHKAGEEAESKAQYEKESCETDKLAIGSELRQVKRELAELKLQTKAPAGTQFREVQKKYDELRDRYDVMFKHNDQLVNILKHNGISPPPPPKVSRGSPPQYRTEQVQREVPATPILTRGPESDSPIDPSTLPQPVDMQPCISVYDQQASQGGNYPQYSQAGGGGQTQYPYTASRDGMQGGHNLMVQGQQGYVDPSQYQGQQSGNLASISEHGFMSGNLEQLRRNQMQHNVGGMAPQGRQRAGSGSGDNRREGNVQDFHHDRQGRGRVMQHGGQQKSLTASHVGAAAGNYGDMHFKKPNQAYARGQVNQFSNQTPNQFTTQSPSNYDNYNHPRAAQQQGNVGGMQQAGANYENMAVQNYAPHQQPPRSAANVGQFHHHQQQQGGHYHMQQQPYYAGEAGKPVGGNSNVSPRQQHRQMLNQQGQGAAFGQGMPGVQAAPTYVQAQQESQNGAPYQVPPSNQQPPNPPNQTGPQENVLIAGIDREIQEVAEDVIQGGQNPEESLPSEAPIDPNLICQMCRRGFRIGEIQRYRRHVATCTGSSSS